MNNIEILEEFRKSIKNFNNYADNTNVSLINKKQVKAIENLLIELKGTKIDLKLQETENENLIQENKKMKEKYKRLSIEAQATAFHDMNKDTEGLLRVLLKQGEITLDEKGYYQRKDFDWEENLTMMGLMKKREKNFYIPDDSLDEYTKQLENQLKEYNEMKEIFKKYYVMGNETMYDGCCKMQDEIDELKEENKELKEKIKGMYDKSNKLIEVTNLYLNSVPRSKIINLLENEVIDISGFECIPARDLQELLEEGDK